MGELGCRNSSGQSMRLNGSSRAPASSPPGGMGVHIRARVPPEPSTKVPFSHCSEMELPLPAQCSFLLTSVESNFFGGGTIMHFLYMGDFQPSLSNLKKLIHL